MKKDRINTTLEEITKPWLSGDRGAIYIQRICDELGKLSSLQIENALHLGHRLNPLTDEILRRHAIRACMLADFTIRHRDLAMRESILSGLQPLRKDQIVQAFQSRFPLVSDNGKRNSWSKRNFTDPRQHQNGNYRYVVYALKRPAEDASNKTKYSAILADPRILQGWVAISCSVIDQAHRTTYRPFGLILSVPKSNVLTTHGEDQMFSNHAGTDVPIGATIADKIRLAAEIKNHIIGKDGEFNGLKTPDEVLANTSNGLKNEVVLLGTSPEQKKITAIGIFVKVQPNGQWHQDLLNDPGYQSLVQNINSASANLGIPVVLIDN